MSLDRKKPSELLGEACEAYQQGDVSRALVLIQQAINSNPKHWYLLATKAAWLSDMPKYADQAELLFIESIRLNPCQPILLNLLGALYYKRQQYELAIQQFERSLELREDFGTLTMLAAASMQVDVGQGLKYASRALDLNPEWDEALAIRERALKILGEDL